MGLTLPHAYEYGNNMVLLGEHAGDGIRSGKYPNAQGAEECWRDNILYWK
jgi:hypothetical protein